MAAQHEGDEHDIVEEPPGGDSTTVIGHALVRYSAYVIITLAVLYFLANYVLPLF